MGKLFGGYFSDEFQTAKNTKAITLKVDLENRRLIDPETSVNTCIEISTCDLGSIKTITGNTQYHRLLVGVDAPRDAPFVVVCDASYHSLGAALQQ